MILFAVLNVELPTGVADLELPDGLTTLLSGSDESLFEVRNSTTLSGVSDPSSYFEGVDLEEVDISLLGWVCDCGKLLSMYVFIFCSDLIMISSILQ